MIGKKKKRKEEEEEEKEETQPRAEQDLRVNIFKIDFMAQNSSLSLVADAESENIGEKQEYMP